jgi:hypothetical protein
MNWYLYRSSTLGSDPVAMFGKLTAFAGLLQGLKLQTAMDHLARNVLPFLLISTDRYL